MRRTQRRGWTAVSAIVAGGLFGGCATDGTSDAADASPAAVINPASPSKDGGSSPAPDPSDATAPSQPTGESSGSSGKVTVSGDRETGPNLDLPSDEGRGPGALPQPSSPPEPPAPSSDPSTRPAPERDAAPTYGDASSVESACGECPAAPDACRAWRCNEEAGSCELVALSSETTCDDGDPCTVADHCDGLGICSGTSRDCSGETSACTAGWCNPDSGDCEAVPHDVGAACDDADACTHDDTCDENGTCRGEATDCGSEDSACTVGTCDPETGECHPVMLDGTTCDDGDACTQDDACSHGECHGVVPETCSQAAHFPPAEVEQTLQLNTNCYGSALENDFDVKDVVPPGSPPEKGDCTNSSGADVFVTLDLTGHVGKLHVFATTDNRNTNFDTVLALLGEGSSSAQCSYSSLLACNDAIQVAPVKNERSTIEAEVAPGTYVLVVDGYLPKDNGRADLSVLVTPL